MYRPYAQQEMMNLKYTGRIIHWSLVYRQSHPFPEARPHNLQCSRCNMHSGMKPICQKKTLPQLQVTWTVFTANKIKRVFLAEAQMTVSIMRPGQVSPSQVETRRPVWSAKCHWYVHLIWPHSVRDASHLVWFIMEISCTPYECEPQWVQATVSASHTECEPY